MSKKAPFSFRSRLKSFAYAAQGLRTLLREEHNAWLHLLAAVGAIVLGCVLNVSSMEWVAIVLCICLVFAAELFNTALETLCDFVSPERQQAIKKVKDLSAAAVLITAAGALATALFIFLPKLVA